jgi:hypothetical protein
VKQDRPGQIKVDRGCAHTEFVCLLFSLVKDEWVSPRWTDKRGIIETRSYSIYMSIRVAHTQDASSARKCNVPSGCLFLYTCTPLSTNRLRPDKSRPWSALSPFVVIWCVPWRHCTRSTELGKVVMVAGRAREDKEGRGTLKPCAQSDKHLRARFLY